MQGNTISVERPDDEKVDFESIISEIIKYPEQWDCSDGLSVKCLPQKHKGLSLNA